MIVDINRIRRNYWVLKYVVFTLFLEKIQKRFLNKDNNLQNRVVIWSSCVLHITNSNE